MIILATALTGCGTAVTSTAPTAPERKTNMIKTLVFNFDGTGDEPSDVKKSRKDKSISNIYKLHLLLGGGTPDVTTPDGAVQRSFYHRGIGTYGDWFRRKENEAVAPLAEDVRCVLDAAHRELHWNHEKGDRVAVFGFSRGAALARKFVSEALKANRSIEIAFLGVFDTVRETGGWREIFRSVRTDKETTPEHLGEHGTLDPHVRQAVHIVSLDERRRTFRPTLINKDSCDPDDLDCTDRILEVWFPGIHTDIGGSHPDDGLGDLALAFMIKNFKKAMGDGDAIRITPGDRASVEALLNELREKDPAQYKDFEADDIVIQPRVDGTLHRNKWTSAWIESGFRHPVSRTVCVKDNDHCSLDDYPLVHHNVKKRFNLDLDPAYRPAALRGVEFKLYVANGKHSKPIQGINGLREVANPAPLE